MKYATFAVWKCELPIVKWKRFAQNGLDQKECFLNTIPHEKKNQKIIIC